MIPGLTKVGLFVGAVFAATFVIHYTWRAFAPHHSENPVVQGVSAVLS